MQYTDNEAALIGGLISTYFFQPAVSASLKDVYSRVLEHLHQNALTSSDLQQIRKAVNFLMPMCQANRQSQKIKNDGSLQVVIQPQGGAIWVSK